MSPAIVVNAAVEGIVDAAIVRRLLENSHLALGEVYGKKGKGHLIQKINAYNLAARFAPWIVLMDLDRDDECAPPFRYSKLPDPAPYLCFRIAVRTIESWLLADRENLSRFLAVAVSIIPNDPENLDNPKETSVNIARRSRRKGIREGMVPRPGSGRTTGPTYSSRIIEFASKDWCPATASRRADSLKRAIRCLERFVHEAI